MWLSWASGTGFRLQIATDTLKNFTLCSNPLGSSFQECRDKLLLWTCIWCAAVSLCSLTCQCCQCDLCRKRLLSAGFLPALSPVSGPAPSPSWFVVHGSLSSFLSLRAPLFCVQVNLQQFLCDCFPAPLSAQPSKAGGGRKAHCKRVDSFWRTKQPLKSALSPLPSSPACFCFLFYHFLLSLFFLHLSPQILLHSFDILFSSFVTCCSEKISFLPHSLYFSFRGIVSRPVWEQMKRGINSVSECMACISSLPILLSHPRYHVFIKYPAVFLNAFSRVESALGRFLCLLMLAKEVQLFILYQLFKQNKKKKPPRMVQYPVN